MKMIAEDVEYEVNLVLKGHSRNHKEKDFAKGFNQCVTDHLGCS